MITTFLDGGSIYHRNDFFFFITRSMWFTAQEAKKLDPLGLCNFDGYNSLVDGHAGTTRCLVAQRWKKDRDFYMTPFHLTYSSLLPSDPIHRTTIQSLTNSQMCLHHQNCPLQITNHLATEWSTSRTDCVHTRPIIFVMRYVKHWRGVQHISRLWEPCFPGAAHSQD
jgi:hypothetical protein